MKLLFNTLRYTLAILIAILSFSKVQAQCTTSPSNLVIIAQTATTATFSWDIMQDAFSYDVTASSDSTPPQKGNMTLNPPYQLQGLVPGMSFCFHVRARCNNGPSAWTTFCFTQPTCTGISPLSIDVVVQSPTAARVSWNAFSPAANYEYAISTSETPPTIGSSTISTLVGVQGMTPNTKHCVHLRAYCGFSQTFTNWQTQCFNTPATAISNVNKKHDFSIYPNPANETINVSLTSITIAHNIQITDLVGKTVYSGIIDKSGAAVDISKLAPGQYFITVSGAEVHSASKFAKAE